MAVCPICEADEIPPTPKRGGMPRVTCLDPACRRSYALRQRNRNYKANQYRTRLWAGECHFCSVCQIVTDLKRRTCGARECVREHTRHMQRIRNQRFRAKQKARRQVPKRFPRTGKRAV